MKYIEEDNIISSKDISVLLHVTDRTIERDIQKLENMELLKRTGSDRGSYWEIK